jgi:beta-lactam-binding protein with PASTA domain
MPGDPGARDRQQLRQLARCGRTGGQRLDQRPSTVIGQSPQAGAKKSRGFRVTLVVGRR